MGNHNKCFVREIRNSIPNPALDIKAFFNQNCECLFFFETFVEFLIGRFDLHSLHPVVCQSHKK